MSSDFEFIPLRLTPLSPIHIGTGEDLSWLGTCLDIAKGQVIRYRSEDLVQSLPQQARTRLDNLGKRALEPSLSVVDFIIEVQQFLKNNIDVARHARSSVSAIAPRLLKRMDEMTGVRRRTTTAPSDTIAAIAIAEAMIDPRSGGACIAGSGVKGALRTAWLDRLAGTMTANLDWKEYQRQLLGGTFDQDPFSQVMVEDFRPSNVENTAIVVARNTKRVSKPGRRQELPVQVAAIVPGSAVDFRGALRSKPRSGGPKSISPKELLRQCHVYHSSHWREQRDDLVHHVPEWWHHAMDRLVERTDLQDNSCLIRIGKFATAESKTTRDRKIKVGVSRSESDRPHGTTFWLSGDHGDEQGLPFGWALLDLGNELQTDLPSMFHRNLPWQAIAGISTGTVERHASNVNVEGPSAESDTPSGKLVGQFETLLKRNQLSFDLLRADLKRAQTWSASDKAILFSWISSRYRDFPFIKRHQYRLIDELLAKLK